MANRNFRRRIAVLSVVAVVLVSVITLGGVGTVAAAGTTDVEVTPASQAIDAGTTTTVNITVTDADGGVGAYNFTLRTADTGTASITHVELHGNPGIADSTISTDGSELSVNAALADTDDTGPVTIATVTVAGDAAGESSLSLSELSVGDESGASYSIGTVTDASLSVRESTAIQDSTVTPDAVDEEQTISTTFDFSVVDVSNDGNTDEITVTAPSDVSLAAPDATVTDADGTPIQIESGPSLSDANGGTDNRLQFAISPDNSLNTSRIGVTVEADATYPAVAANQSVSYDLDVIDSSGETATDSTSVAIQTTSDEDGGGPTQAVSITPAEQNISVGETTTYDVVVSDVTNGVGAYDLNITTGNASLATITAVELGGNPPDSTTSITYAQQDASVQIETALADTVDTGDVAIITFTVSGEAGGNATIVPTIGALGDEDGNSYNVTTVESGSLHIQAGPGDVTGNGDAATDPDGDGTYEDINGDGSADVLDVQALFGGLDNAEISGTTAFDVNGDGSVDILDVQSLFSEI